MNDFSDVVLNSLLAIENGAAEKVRFLFKWRQGAQSMTTITSHLGKWMLIDGHHDAIELLHDGNSARAAARLCWIMGARVKDGGEWTLID